MYWQSVPFVDIPDSKLQKNKLTQHDIVIARTGGTIGKSFLLEDNIDFEAVYASYLIRVRATEYRTAAYLSHFLKSPNYWEQLGAANNGTAQPNVNATSLKSLMLPLPPLAEQERIVNEIELMSQQIDKYKVAYEKLENLNSGIQARLNASILQYAMQGKLTNQRAEDGSVDDLLAQITAEKEQLILDKKIKRDKELPPISEDEIPFQIPSNWKWVRLSQVGRVTSGGTPSKTNNDYWNRKDIPWITPAWMGKNKKEIRISYPDTYISFEGLSNSSAQLINGGSIVYSSRAPIGYINIVDFEYATNQGAKSITAFGGINVEYLYYALKSMTPSIRASASGTTFSEISGTIFSNVMVPLPSYEEQLRIVQSLKVVYKSPT